MRGLAAEMILSQEMTFHLTHRSVKQWGEMPRINELFRKEPRIWDQDEPSSIMIRCRGNACECFGFSIQPPRVHVFQHRPPTSN